jgi:hypothetical protein
MGYRTPNIDSIAEGGMIFTDYYGEQSCTAGRSPGKAYSGPASAKLACRVPISVCGRKIQPSPNC